MQLLRDLLNWVLDRYLVQDKQGKQPSPRTSASSAAEFDSRQASCMSRLGPWSKQAQNLRPPIEATEAEGAPN